MTEKMTEKEYQDIEDSCTELKDFLKYKGNTLFFNDSKEYIHHTKMLSRGNSFLGFGKDKEEKIQFYVFNLPQELTCPEATITCKAYCYEKGIEELRIDARLKRKKNLFCSLEDSFVENMTKEILSYRPSKEKEVVIRIHESGDFYNEDYLISWLEIALRVKQSRKKYIFQTYTKSVDILDHVMATMQDILHKRYKEVTGQDKQEDLELKDFGIKIMGSIMDETNESSDHKRKIFNKYGMNIYEAIIIDDESKVKYHPCDGKEHRCSICKLCYLKDVDIMTAIRKKDKIEKANKS